MWPMDTAQPSDLFHILFNIEVRNYLVLDFCLPERLAIRLIDRGWLNDNMTGQDH